MQRIKRQPKELRKNPSRIKAETTKNNSQRIHKETMTKTHETNLLVDKEFAVKDPSRLPIPTQKEETLQKGGLFYCTEAKCNCSCSSLDDLDLHESFGEHCRFMNNEGLYDTLRRERAASYPTVTHIAATEDISDRLARLTTQRLITLI